ncbi:MAG: hypothetical protein JXA71_08750 [Chitinispirillaceae bacterium]|nr:hypothetical protein [Chitinispirillaceae bacterium]
MAKEKILIIAKTYPRPSKKYDELVCTAGVRADGSWVRIYPVPFRKLDFEIQFKKFQWIEADIERNLSDSRPESHKLKSHHAIRILNEIPTDKDGSWQQRRQLLLKHVYTNRAALVKEAYLPGKRTSLAVFKLQKITDFKIQEESNREWDKEKLEFIKARAQQIDLFAGERNPFEVVKKIPYSFSYEFQDDEHKTSTLRIIDWEIGALFLNSMRRHKNDEKKACADVRKKYWDDFALTKDVYLILGTTLEYHNRNAPNPFVIIGVFPPKHEQKQNAEQMKMEL